MYWYRFHRSGFKGIPVVLLCLTMQILAEDAMYVSQGYIPMLGGDAAYQRRCAWRLSLPHDMINQ